MDFFFYYYIVIYVSYFFDKYNFLKILSAVRNLLKKKLERTFGKFIIAVAI
jgi:hypothetical protein